MLRLILIITMATFLFTSICFAPNIKTLTPYLVEGKARNAHEFQINNILVEQDLINHTTKSSLGNLHFESTGKDQNITTMDIAYDSNGQTVLSEYILEIKNKSLDLQEIYSELSKKAGDKTSVQFEPEQNLITIKGKLDKPITEKFLQFGLKQAFSKVYFFKNNLNDQYYVTLHSTVSNDKEDQHFVLVIPTFR